MAQKSKLVILILLAVVVGIFFMIQVTIGKHKRSERLSEEYELITDTAYLEIKVKRFFSNHCTTYITTDNYDKMRFHPWTISCDGKLEDLCLFLEVGDSIVKNADSDLVHIIRNGVKFCYKIENVEGSNYPKQ